MFNGYQNLNTNKPTGRLSADNPGVIDWNENLLEGAPSSNGSSLNFNIFQNIKNNAAALLNYVKNNKATVLLGGTTALLATKILYDYVYRPNYEAEMPAFQNATEQVFCLMKNKIFSLIQNESDADSLQEQFSELLANMDEKIRPQVNKTINFQCVNL